MTFTTHPRLNPYSILDHSFTMVPFSFMGCEIHPATIKLFDLRQHYPIEFVHIQLPTIGSVDKFSCHLDLEKGKIEVSGFLENGFFRYEIEAKEPKNILIRFLKVPNNIRPKLAEIKPILVRRDENLPFELCENLESGDILVFEVPGDIKLPNSRERLMLGSHKSQDVEMMRRRKDLTEILPIWFYLSQSIALDEFTTASENSLFSELEYIIKDGCKEKITKKLLNIFKTGFKSIFLPEFYDHTNLGLEKTCYDKSSSPLNFLCSSFSLIRSLFFKESGAVLEFLPLTPPEFHAGKLLDIKTVKGHKISFEWSKKAVRRIVIQLFCDDTLSFKFKSDIKNFRIRDFSSLKEINIFENKSDISLKQGIYILDKFQK